jgi:hypothetical protein
MDSVPVGYIKEVPPCPYCPGIHEAGQNLTLMPPMARIVFCYLDPVVSGKNSNIRSLNSDAADITELAIDELI